MSNSLERFLFLLLLLDVTPTTSRAGMISLSKYVGIYIKLKLVHGTLDVQHSCTSVVSFTLKNNSPNFINNLEKNFPEMLPKKEHSMKFFLWILSQKFPKTVAQHAFSNFIVFQIKGEYQFNYLEHAVLVSYSEARIKSGDLKLIYLWRGAIPVQ